MKKRIKDLPCLFLDRDGVINEKRHDDYVKSWDQFIFLPKVLIALKELKKYFSPIIIVTNQQGIGKGLMSEHDLKSIHYEMNRIIRKSGGKIDRVLYCPDLNDPPSLCRKPNTEMGLQAKYLFPEIQWDRSIMVGDSVSDIHFGKNLGMQSILLNQVKEDPSGQADFVFRDLMDFYLNFVKKSTRSHRV
ncbi:MAG: HAD-IIIA family hydrolase [Saprospiraceae bacterium]|nr:HAD-IIIA family hydrolase [Saprospiraceae bacterium]